MGLQHFICSSTLLTSTVRIGGSPIVGLQPGRGTSEYPEGEESELAEARLWDCNRYVLYLDPGRGGGQNWRKPDCGIATFAEYDYLFWVSASELAEARLWDCNFVGFFWRIVAGWKSELAEARLWDCNIDVLLRHFRKDKVRIGGSPIVGLHLSVDSKAETLKPTG